MKIQLDRKELAETLRWVASALDKRPSSPAMCGVRITVTETEATFTAWGYTAAHSATLYAPGAEPGEVLAPGSSLSSLVAAMRGRDVTLAESGQALEIVSGASTYRLRLLPLSDYSAPPAPPEKPIGAVSGPALAEAVGAVEWAAARNELLSNLFQIHMEADGDALVFAATNRFIFGVDACGYSGEPFTAGVQPSMLASAVAGLAGEAEVGIGLSDSLLSLIGASRTVSLRLVADEFVKWRAVMEAPLPERLTIDAGELADAGRRVASLAADQAPVIVTVVTGAVALTASGETGEGCDVLVGEATSPVETGFNAAYLAAALKHFGGQVEIQYADKGKPWRITSPTLPSRVSVVMSKRVVR